MDFFSVKMGALHSNLKNLLKENAIADFRKIISKCEPNSNQIIFHREILDKKTISSILN